MGSSLVRALAESWKHDEVIESRFNKETGEREITITHVSFCKRCALEAALAQGSAGARDEERVLHSAKKLMRLSAQAIENDNGGLRMGRDEKTFMFGAIMELATALKMFKDLPGSDDIEKFWKEELGVDGVAAARSEGSRTSDIVEEMLAAAVHMAELNEVPAKATVARWRKELLKRGDEPALAAAHPAQAKEKE